MEDSGVLYSNLQALLIACDVFRQKQSVSNDLFYDGQQLLCVRLPWTFSHGIRACFSSYDSMVERYVSSQYQIIAI
ncbi:hypothetical protein SAMN05216327_104521 [Dyadobacter sp. SG02]|nr:hypothetical protein SAMN05216327_104521 [Dyadobacter sp. SG02]